MKTRAHGRGRRIAIVGIVVAGVITASVASAFVVRDPLATLVVARGLGSAGLRCDHVAVHLPASLSPSSFQLAPMRCTRAHGPLAAIRFVAPLVVRLDGAHVHSASCATIDVDLRAQHRTVALNTLGDVSRVVGLDQPGTDLVLDWAALATPGSPPFSAGLAVIRRGGRRAVEIHELRLSPDHDGQSVSGRDVHVDQVSALGAATLRGHATRQRAAITLVFDGHLQVDVTGRHLASPHPAVDFSVGVASP